MDCLKCIRRCMGLAILVLLPIMLNQEVQASETQIPWLEDETTQTTDGIPTKSEVWKLESEIKTETEETVEVETVSEDFVSIHEEGAIKQRYEYTLAEIATKLEELNATYSIELENEIDKQLTSLENELQEHPEFPEIQNDCFGKRIKFEQYQNCIKSAKNKFAQYTVSNNMDMSKPIGFSEEELRYILFHLKNNDSDELLIPETLIDDFSASISNEGINEFLVVSVMVHETGWFKSNLCTKYNNFGGIMGQDGPLKFDTQEEGIKATVDCIKNNIRENSTIFDINKSYCAPSDLNGNGVIDGDEEKYNWSYKVLSIMRQIAEEETSLLASLPSFFIIFFQNFKIM